MAAKPRIALCIGNNKYPTDWDADLVGCVPDAKNLTTALADRGWQVTQLLNASRPEILAAAQETLAAAGPKGFWAITNSSHGTQLPDDNGDEADLMDEATCCSDGGLIRDDEWWKLFRSKPAGSSGFFLSDSCHSGTVARKIGPPILVRNDAGEIVGKRRYIPYQRIAPEWWNSIELRNAPTRDLAAPRLFEEGGWLREAEGAAKVPWPVLLLAGCQDNEYSYDAVIHGKPCGAFTHFFLQALSEVKPGATFNDVFVRVRDNYLPSRQYPQTPRMIGSYLKSPVLFG